LDFEFRFLGFRFLGFLKLGISDLGSWDFDVGASYLDDSRGISGSLAVGGLRDDTDHLEIWASRFSDGRKQESAPH
jgi:hypothetical protein